MAADIACPLPPRTIMEDRCNVGRLVLRRRSGESLTIGNDINIEVFSAPGNGREGSAIRFKIGEDVKVEVAREGRHVKFIIEAPESTLILRDELTKRPTRPSAEEISEETSEDPEPVVRSLRR